MIAFSLRRAGRVATAIAVSLLAVVLLFRVLSAVLESLALLGLVFILASVTLPHGLRFYWRKLRGTLLATLESLLMQLRSSEAREETPPSPPSSPSPSSPSTSSSSPSPSSQPTA